MKVKSGFLMYLFIFIGLVLGACLIMVAIMLFSPGTSIFGLEWVSENKIGTYSSYDSDFDEISNYDTVIINALQNDTKGNNIGYGYYNVDIRVGLRDAVNTNFVVENKVQGLVKTAEKTEYSIQFNISEDKKTLTVNVVQINTWLANSGASKITLNIPENQNVSNINFIVNTGSGNVDFGGSAGRDSEPIALKAKSLTANTTSGSISVQELTTASSSVNFKSNSGKITFLSENFTTITMSVQSSSGTITLPNIKANSLTISTEKSIVDGGDINANLTLDSSMGVVRLGNVTGNVTGTEKLNGTDIELGTVSGELGIPSARNVVLEAKEVKGFVNIVTEKGRIYIGNSYKEPTSNPDTISTGISSRANITTTSGEIKVFITSDNNQLVNLTTLSGKITAYIASSNGNKNITTNNGNIEVYLAQTTSLDLISETKNQITFDWEEEIIKNNIVYKEIRGNDEFNNAILKIKSNTGKIDIERLTNLSFN